MAGTSYEAVPMSDVPFTQRQSLERRIPPASPSVSNEAGLQEASLAEKGSGRSSAISQQSDRHLQGWRAGVTGVTCLVFAVLLVNISFLIWALSTHGHSGGIAPLQRGSCQTSEKLNTWVHLVINLLSTGMLSGSNYCR